MRKKLTILLSAVTLLGTMATASERIPADVNGDGKVNTADVVEVYNFILNMRTANSVTISDFPAMGWSDDETIGTPDAGKSAWAVGDMITLSLESPAFGTKSYTLTYDGEQWNSDVELDFTYLANEQYTATASYAPICEPGLVEYLVAESGIDEDKININFKQGEYSRLRIAASAGQSLTVTTTGFTPAGASEEATEAYTLTANENGNAYLYGTFAEGATVTVKKGDTELVTYPFTAATVQGNSYALFAGVTVDLSKLTETYVINDSKNYHFTGTGSYGIKVESGNPGIILNNANITLTQGVWDNPVNGIHIASTSGTTTIHIIGENTITPKVGAGIFTAEGGTVKITGSNREDVLTVTGAQGCSGIGGYVLIDTGNYDLFYFNCGNIEISNVTVRASGCRSEFYDVSPAIGGAANANCGYITIDNADVYAEGFIDNQDNAGSAAIGTGLDQLNLEGGTIGEISIMNYSKVYVTKGSYSDYIGRSGDFNTPQEGAVTAIVDETSEVIKQN